MIKHGRIHVGEKPFKCRHCDKLFNNRSNLVQHERSHTGEKPFKCKHCDKSFSRSSHLVTHERLHTGEKPFKCKHCDKSFADRSHLVKHERLHTGEKPFKCKQCDKSFVQRSGLVKHERTHTGERPYSCNICNKSFTTSTSLHNHEKKWHDFVIKEELCGKSDVLNEFVYNPGNEAHHSGASTYKSFKQKSSINENEKRVHINSSNFDGSICQKVDETQEYASLQIESDVKEEEDNEVLTTGNHEMFGQSENICEETEFIAVASNQDVKEEIIQDVKTESFPQDNNVFTCDVCQEIFSERDVLFMHMNLNHT